MSGIGTAERAWESVAGTFAAVVEHPFVTGLQDGTLPQETFDRYLVDDARYLDRYARVLAQLAVRAPTTEGVALLAGAAEQAVVAERELHRALLATRGAAPDAGEGTPTCVAYTGFLMSRAVTAPFDVALGAVLPCFRVYAEVGRGLLERCTSDRYRSWIEAYAAPEFWSTVRRVEGLLDAVVVDEAAVLEAYGTATGFEWSFWDASWRGEEPVGPT